MKRPAPTPLPYQIRADLFLHLATTERAGLSTEQAYAMLQLPAPAKERLDIMRRLLKRGMPPPEAGLRSGLFTSLENKLLKAAFESGSPEPSYRRLAETYAIKVSQLRKIKSRMVLPVAVMSLALCIGPLPMLVAGSIGPGAYLWHVLRPLLILGALAWLALRGPALFLAGEATPARESLERLLLNLPLFGKMHARRNARDFAENLGLLLGAGVPMFDALPIAEQTVNNSLMREEFERLTPALERGLSLSTAAVCLTLFDTSKLVGFIITGEASGALPEMLERFARGESESLALFQENLAEWLPRLFYAGVAAWMAWQLIGGAK